MVDQLLKEGKSRKPSWKNITANFNAIGLERNPEQCSSMWSSLVKKYEVVTCSNPVLLLPVYQHHSLCIIHLLNLTTLSHSVKKEPAYVPSTNYFMLLRKFCNPWFVAVSYSI